MREAAARRRGKLTLGVFHQISYTEMVEALVAIAYMRTPNPYEALHRRVDLFLKKYVVEPLRR